MKYNQLELNKSKQPRRKGRGISSGRGKTAGRGTKGQNSRAGGRRRPGFEGGQMPLSQRMPKLRGLGKGNKTMSAKKTKAENIYTGQLDAFANKNVDNYVLFENGLVSSPHTIVKVIVKGELKTKVTVSLQSASRQAEEAITKAGGSFKKVEQIPRQAKITK